MVLAYEPKVSSYRVTGRTHQQLRTEHNRSPLQLWTTGIMSTSDVTALGGICGFDELSEVSIYLFLFWSKSITN